MAAALVVVLGIVGLSILPILVIFILVNNCLYGPDVVTVKSKKTFEDSQFKFLSWNIFAMNGKPYLHERCEVIRKLIKNFDVIFLQESWTLPILTPNFWVVRKLQAAAKRQGFNMISGFRHGCRFTDSGLAVLSRFPIAEYEFKLFPYSMTYSVDALASKGVLYAKIDLPNMTALHGFNTHLNAYYEKNDGPKREIAQKAQIEFMIEFIKEKTRNIGADDKVLLCGDFNCDEPMVKFLLEKMNKVNFKYEEGETSSIMHYKEDGEEIESKIEDMGLGSEEGKDVVENKFDWLFYKDEFQWHIGTRIMRAPGKPFDALSDHRAIIADIPFLDDVEDDSDGVKDFEVTA